MGIPSSPPVSELTMVCMIEAVPPRLLLMWSSPDIMLLSHLCYFLVVVRFYKCAVNGGEAAHCISALFATTPCWSPCFSVAPFLKCAARPLKNCWLLFLPPAFPVYTWGTWFYLLFLQYFFISNGEIFIWSNKRQKACNLSQIHWRLRGASLCGFNTQPWPLVIDSIHL